MKNKNLRKHYDQVYSSGAHKYYTFSSFDESMKIIEMMDDLNGKKVLEVGCGLGGLASILAQAGGNVYAIDYSLESINQAKAKYDCENLKFVCDDYKNLVDKYDVIVLQGVLEHFDDPFNDLDWLICNLLEANGYIITSSPSFLNPRGYIWMTLQLLFDVPMSLSDLHFLCPFDFDEFCKKRNYKLIYDSSNQDWGNGEQMIIDFNKRLRNALRDAGMNNLNVDKLLNWLDKAKEYTVKNENTGANVIYKISKV